MNKRLGLNKILHLRVSLRYHQDKFFLKLFIVTTAVYFFSGFNTAQARDDFESALLLKEAIMVSNGDYNKHRERINQEEFDRGIEWRDQTEGMIMIGEGNDSLMAPSEIQESGRGLSSQ